MKSLFIFLGASLLAVNLLAAECAVSESEKDGENCGCTSSHCSVVACKCGGKCGCGK